MDLPARSGIYISLPQPEASMGPNTSKIWWLLQALPASINIKNIQKIT
jgi:hypothetical protein